MRKLLFAGMVVAATLTVAPAAYAVDIPYTTDGIWVDEVAGGCCTINNGANPRIISWGVPDGFGQSGYTFAPLGLQLPGAPTNGTPFALGTFSHLNFPIFPPVLDNVNLDFTLTLDPGGLDQTIVTGKFNFDHTETPNDGNPCAEGGSQPCRDKVVVTNLVLNKSFTYKGNQYFFNLLGFSAGPTFYTNENAANPADLFGIITTEKIPEVPEPTSMLLLGTGLLGAVRRLRRK